MKEYIVTEHPDFPYEEPKPQELIRCKDCKWYIDNYISEEPYYGADGFHRWGGLACCQHENGLTECSDETYCSCGERKANEDERTD